MKILLILLLLSCVPMENDGKFYLVQNSLLETLVLKEAADSIFGKDEKTPAASDIPESIPVSHDESAIAIENIDTRECLKVKKQVTPRRNNLPDLRLRRAFSNYMEGYGNITAEWNPPVDSSTVYDIRIGDCPWEKTSAFLPQFSFSNLPSKETYTITLKKMTGYANHIVISAYLNVAPSVPSNIKVELIGNDAVVSWYKSYDEDGTISNYYLFLSGNREKEGVSVAGNKTKHTFKNLNTTNKTKSIFY